MTYDELLSELSLSPVLHGRAPSAERIIIGGMGGSALAGDALAFLVENRVVDVHRTYGLPNGSGENALYIAISYSGNTAETIDFLRAAYAKQYPCAVVASGGILLQFAKEHSLPYAVVPEGRAPRNALAHLVQGLLALLGEDKLLAALSKAAPAREALEEAAEEDAKFLVDGIPLFYTSERNALLGRMGTLIMNESARTPAFRNVFPEMNHNELQAFDTDMPEGLMHTFRMMLIRDESDDPRILRRMQVFEKLMRDRERTVRILDLSGMGRAEALVLMWLRFLGAARHLAESRGINPDTEPLIEEFKTLL